MKKDQDIIEMLESGKKVSLSTEERDSIKFTLLDHARKSLSYEKSRFWNSLWFKQVVPAFAVIMFVFLGTAYASQDSLPGDPLYAMKVNVVEELFSVSKIDPVKRTEYEISRMDMRLEELKVLSESNTFLEEDELATVVDHIDQHASDVVATLTETEESIISHEEKIDTLNKLNSYAKAQVQIIDENTELSSISDDIHASEETISDSLVNAVEEFSEEAPMDVSEYLSEQIKEVGTELQATSTEAEVRESAEKHVHDVNESLAEGDTTSALLSVLEAQQTIDASGYLKEGSGKEESTE